MILFKLVWWSNIIIFIKIYLIFQVKNHSFKIFIMNLDNIKFINYLFNKITKSNLFISFI